MCNIIIVILSCEGDDSIGLLKDFNSWMVWHYGSVMLVEVCLGLNFV